MGDLTELIRAEIEAKRKEVQKRHEQSCEELNSKSSQEHKSLKKLEKDLVKIKKFILSLEEEEEEEVMAAAVEEIDDNEFLKNFSVMTDATIVPNTIVTTTDSVNNSDNNNNGNNDNNVDYIIDTIEKLDRPIGNDNNSSDKNVENNGKNVNDFYSSITTNDVIHNNGNNSDSDEDDGNGNCENDENDIVEISYSSNENALNKESRKRNNHSSSFTSPLSSSLSPLLSSTTFKSNDTKPPPNNHLTNRKIEINKARERYEELLSRCKKITENKQKIVEKLKREREVYQKTLQEHDEFELKLTTISEGFESDQNHALLDLVKELKENGIDHNNEEDKSSDEIANNDVIEGNNKRKGEEVSDNGEMHTSKKAKYVATGVLIGLAPWVINNLPLLQQHLQNLPFI